MSEDIRTVTGIPGVDEVLGGGIPKGRVVLIVGGPGTGKTILSTQYIHAGATKFGENGMYISLDEGRNHYMREMLKFGWDLVALEKEKKFTFVDSSPVRRRLQPGQMRVEKLAIGRKDFSLDALLELVQSQAKSNNIQRVVVDPVASLAFQYPDLIQRRTVFLDLVEALADTGATSMLTTELRAAGMERSVQLEEYLAHGVIVLQTLQVGRSLVRVLQIEKMRETSIDAQPRPYKITETGIEVFPKESVF